VAYRFSTQKMVHYHSSLIACSFLQVMR